MPNGRMVNASALLEDAGDLEELVLSPAEEAMNESLVSIISGILNLPIIDPDTDFFKAAGCWAPGFAQNRTVLAVQAPRAWT
jgi:hypothetical protein